MNVLSKARKRALIIIVASFLLLTVLFLPIPRGTCDDGGTRDYRALTYRVILWNRLTVEMEAEPDGSMSVSRVGTYRRTAVYWFADATTDIDELWERETARPDYAEHIAYDE